MSQAAIVINVSNFEQAHANGLSGNFIVPAKKAGEKFGMLVIFPTPEIQDIGEQRKVVHWLKAKPIAMDVVGLRSDAAAHGLGVSGTKEKWGILLCEAEPDLPKSLIKALEDEMEFLNNNPPDVKMRIDQKTKAVVATNVEDVAVREEKIRLSDLVASEKEEFFDYCRRLVTKAEVERANKLLQLEDQRLVAEGDRMWARRAEQQNINELHRNACTRLGQERPWSYIPQQLVDCPGCGAKIKENILSCPQCGGWLDEGIEKLRQMEPKVRVIKMYPNRDAQPVGAGSKG